MFTKLLIPTLVLVIGMAGTSSIARAAEGKTPARTPIAVQAQESGRVEVKDADANTAAECYAVCKRLAEFDNSASKPSKPGLAAAKKAELRSKAGEYCALAKDTGTCDLKCPYCDKAMAMNK